MKKRKRRARATDFTLENLPKNRLSLFFDVLKNNWRKLLLIGLFFLLSVFPLIGINFYFDTVNYSFYNDLLIGKIDQQTYREYYNLNILLNGCFSALAILLASIPLAGLMKIIKRLVFLDPVFFKEDFLSGIKENGAFFVLIGLNASIFIAFDSLVLLLQTSNVVKGIAIGVSFVFVFPILLIMLSMVPIYKVKFISCWLNSFKLYIKHFPFNILMTAVVLSPFALSFIQIIAVKYIIIVCVCLLISPLLLVGLFDYCCYMFDESINKAQYPNYYRKGLAVSKEEKQEEVVGNESCDDDRRLD